MSDFMLGRKSRENLRGVHRDLVKVVERAIKVTTADFTVLEGLRSEERQRQLVAAGASWTMNSRHLTGHAVDLAAWVGTGISWDWPLYYRICDAMKIASGELGIPLEWGGTWARLEDVEPTPEEAMAAYIQRRRAAGKSARTDGPHYQLPWEIYPAT